MADVNDMDLMREYADRNSEPAFAELVHRHINLVYSVALRYVGNSQDAQDVTQAVFIILAKKAANLRQRTILTGWLYETTRFTASQLFRTKARQQIRDHEAYMQSTLNDLDTGNVWRQLAPHLEEAMTRLTEKERTLLALRFYENKTGAEVAAAMGIQEAAAHKRSARAVEKLRTFFARRGIGISAGVLIGAVSANSVQAAPAALAKTISAVAVAKGAAAGGSTLTLVKGALKIMAWTKVKTAVVVGASVLLAASTTTVVIQHQHHLATRNGVSRAAWAFSGYGNPKSAMMSFLWAIRQADGEQILAACSPGLQQTFQKHFEKQMQASGKPLGEFISQDAPARFKNTTGIRILEQKPVSADQVVLRVWDLGEQKGYQITVKKIGDEWKVDGVVG